MRDLAALLASTEGRRLLDEAATTDDPEIFLDRLNPPAEGDAGVFPVHTHQQVCLDYGASVVAKFLAMRDLAERSDAVRADFLRIDTDRAASDRLALRIVLPGAHGPVAVRFAPPGCERTETRFIELDPVRCADAVRRLEQVVGQMPDSTKATAVRFDRLRPLLLNGGSLADLGRRVADFLLEETLSFRPRPVEASSLVARGCLAPALERLIERQEQFVAVVNREISRLRALDVDPGVKPLMTDYLPLFMTCPVDGARLRLRLVRDGARRFAVADGRSGRHYRFELGAGGTVLDGLSDAVGWSPDISLPLLVNASYSGMVAGRSSALYMLVFRAAVTEVLEMTPIPVLVPDRWDGLPAQSLLGTYLGGSRV